MNVRTLPAIVMLTVLPTAPVVPLTYINASTTAFLFSPLLLESVYAMATLVETALLDRLLESGYTPVLATSPMKDVASTVPLKLPLVASTLPLKLPSVA